MLTGHTKEVTAVAWCPTDLSKIATCSDDNDLRLWRVNRGKMAPGEITGKSQPYVGNGKDMCVCSKWRLYGSFLVLPAPIYYILVV